MGRMTYFYNQKAKEAKGLHKPVANLLAKFLQKQQVEIVDIVDLQSKNIPHRDYELRGELVGIEQAYALEVKNDLHADSQACCVEFCACRKLTQPVLPIFSESKKYSFASQEAELGRSYYEASVYDRPGLLLAGVDSNHWVALIRSPFGIGYLLNVQSLQQLAMSNYKRWDFIVARNPEHVSMSFAIPFVDINEALLSGELRGRRFTIGELR